MLNRSVRNAPPNLAFTALEIDLLSRLGSIRAGPKSQQPGSMQSSLTQLACLGGYLARANDAPPGNTVIWRGLSRLTNIALGFQLGAQNVGN
jgi:hypothetical protein